ncbi:hypothetical protein [Halovenus sp. HT40]|uniref:hypothetical protein n=1 Tax=Halovenus sp. HT40 TaxID=3126691 RepID=UPI00300F5F97
MTDRQQRRESMDMTVKQTWEEGSGETHTLYARVTVTDPDTGESGTFKLRNTVDIGLQLFAESDVSNDFKTRARRWLREFAPIYTGHRQFPSDGRQQDIQR